MWILIGQICISSIPSVIVQCVSYNVQCTARMDMWPRQCLSPTTFSQEGSHKPIKWVRSAQCIAVSWISIGHMKHLFCWCAIQFQVWPGQWQWEWQWNCNENDNNNGSMYCNLSESSSTTDDSLRQLSKTRSVGPRGPTFSLRPYRPPLGPSDLLWANTQSECF